MAKPTWYDGPFLIWWNDEQPECVEGIADDDCYDLKIDGGILYLRCKADTNIVACAPHTWSQIKLYATDGQTYDLFPNG